MLFLVEYSLFYTSLSSGGGKMFVVELVFVKESDFSAAQKMHRYENLMILIVDWANTPDTMLFDLNVPWPSNNYSTTPTTQQINTLLNTISTLYALGYTHIAINFTLNENVRLPNNQQSINPIQINMLKEHFKEFTKLKLFTRLTLVVNDPSQCHGLSKVQNSFDLIAVQPTSEKGLQLATTNLDIDLISFNMASKLPFFLKHKTIGSALEKGIKFEICYSPVISGPAGYSVLTANDNMSLSKTALLARKYFFSNVLQLIRASRSKGMIVSSGATQPLQVRNLSDILTLLKTVGLDNSRAKSSVTDNPEKVLVNGRLKIKSYKQTIAAGNDNKRTDLLYENDNEDDVKKSDSSGYKKKLSESSGGNLLKKQRVK